jgi:nitrogen regulatory protein PII-like uncharacterized protein
MPKPITFNIQRLIAAVAAEHSLILKPDDAAFAIVTMNRLVLEESLEAIRAVVAEELAQFKQTAQWAQSSARSAIEYEIQSTAAVLHDAINRDLGRARIHAVEIVEEVKAAYEKPMSNRKFTILSLAGLLIWLVGFCMGRLSV